jgi:hypothetical protein
MNLHEYYILFITYMKLKLFIEIKSCFHLRAYSITLTYIARPFAKIYAHRFFTERVSSNAHEHNHEGD